MSESGEKRHHKTFRLPPYGIGVFKDPSTCAHRPWRGQLVGQHETIDLAGSNGVQSASNGGFGATRGVVISYAGRGSEELLTRARESLIRITNQ